MSAPFAKALFVVIAVIAGWTLVSAFPPKVEQEVCADFAIERYLHETHPWWTCEFTEEFLPREGSFLVRRIVLAGEAQCSRSHQDERFDVVYDPEQDKIVKVRNPDMPEIIDMPDLTNR